MPWGGAWGNWWWICAVATNHSLVPESDTAHALSRSHSSRTGPKLAPTCHRCSADAPNTCWGLQ
eukprot:3430629-Alexandrium_andersonii.AAC.1